MFIISINSIFPLTDEQLDNLIAFSRELRHSNGEFQRFIEENQR